MDEREKVLAKWEPAVKQLLRIPVHDEFKRYGGDEKVSRKVNVLADFFEVKEVQTAAATSGILAQRFEKDVNELGATIEDICSRTLNLKTAIQRGGAKAALNVDDQLAGLLEEVDVLVNKIRTDNEYARNLQGPKSASAASKRAYASTTDYLPGLTAVAVDIGKLLTATTEQKVQLLRNALTAKN
jgi:autophagy-related protein 11